MYRQATLVIFVLFIIAINALSHNMKLCSNKLTINGTSLITQHRNQVLVLGVTHLGCQACRNQAVRYNDLFRDLAYQNIREPNVRLILVNEEHALQYLPGTYYGKIRIYQDNSRDRLISKLGHHGERLNNLIFGRCGELVYTQRYPQSNIEDEANYQQLLRIAITISKYKQPCSNICNQ